MMLPFLWVFIGSDDLVGLCQLSSEVLDFLVFGFQGERDVIDGVMHFSPHKFLESLLEFLFDLGLEFIEFIDLVVGFLFVHE